MNSYGRNPGDHTWILSAKDNAEVLFTLPQDKDVWVHYETVLENAVHNIPFTVMMEEY